MRCWDLREGRQLQQHDFSSQVPAGVWWEGDRSSRIVAPLLLLRHPLPDAGQTRYLLSVFIFPVLQTQAFPSILQRHREPQRS